MAYMCATHAFRPSGRAAAGRFCTRTPGGYPMGCENIKNRTVALYAPNQRRIRLFIGGRQITHYYTRCRLKFLRNFTRMLMVTFKDLYLLSIRNVCARKSQGEIKMYAYERVNVQK